MPQRSAYPTTSIAEAASASIRLHLSHRRASGRVFAICSRCIQEAQSPRKAEDQLMRVPKNRLGDHDLKNSSRTTISRLAPPCDEACSTTVLPRRAGSPAQSHLLHCATDGTDEDYT